MENIVAIDSESLTWAGLNVGLSPELLQTSNLLRTTTLIVYPNKRLASFAVTYKKINRKFFDSRPEHVGVDLIKYTPMELVLLGINLIDPKYMTPEGEEILRVKLIEFEDYVDSMEGVPYKRRFF